MGNSTARKNLGSKTAEKQKKASTKGDYLKKLARSAGWSKKRTMRMVLFADRRRLLICEPGHAAKQMLQKE